jgi:hypothetical protein
LLGDSSTPLNCVFNHLSGDSAGRGPSRTAVIPSPSRLREVHVHEGGAKEILLSDTSSDRAGVGTVAAEISNAIVHLVSVVLRDTLTKGSSAWSPTARSISP